MPATVSLSDIGSVTFRVVRMWDRNEETGIKGERDRGAHTVIKAPVIIGRKLRI